ncbi:Phenylacetic acid catabolic protein [Pararhodobacter sp. SW119]|uniref:Phenylacetic acid catabolic protein n=1 Tax=Pararhodobacter sp. SW119 TaxID=2780075 RepID=UPI001ADF5695|nr:Phenylacetic acid catabolic protein [Pararhodobacter sp. SW119]
MTIEDYLAQGGKLTSPGNVPPRYRGELLRLMATFVDSELAGSAGFADTINDAPGIKSRIAAARIVLEKADHAERVLKIMAEFGANTDRYEGVHPWTARLARDADIGASRQGGDMRLSVFHYPLQGWVDAVVMNVLQGAAAVIQLREFAKISYQPLAEVFRAVAPREARHYELGCEGLAKIVETDDGREQARASLAYWTPRVEAGFGPPKSTRFDTLSRFGLRHRPNAALLADWRAETGKLLSDLHLT